MRVCACTYLCVCVCTYGYTYVRMGEWLYTFVYMHIKVRCTALSPSALFPRRQALSQNLEIFFSQANSQLVPEILLPPLPPPPVPELQAYRGMPGFYMGAGNL